MIDLLEAAAQILSWAAENRKKYPDDDEFFKIIVNASQSISERFDEEEKKNLMAETVLFVEKCYLVGDKNDKEKANSF